MDHLSHGAQLLHNHEYAEAISAAAEEHGYWASIRPLKYGAERDAVISRGHLARRASQDIQSAWLAWINDRVHGLLSAAMATGDKGANFDLLYNMVMNGLRAEINALADESKSEATNTAAEAYNRAFARHELAISLAR